MFEHLVQVRHARRPAGTWSLADRALGDLHVHRAQLPELLRDIDQSLRHAVQRARFRGLLIQRLQA